jgi:hypothetical protein
MGPPITSAAQHRAREYGRAGSRHRGSARQSIRRGPAASTFCQSLASQHPRIATKSKGRLACALRPSRSRKATFCDLNHRCGRDAGLFSLAAKAMLDRDGPDAFPFLALARIRSSRSCGAVNRRRVYSGACVGHLNRPQANCRRCRRAMREVATITPIGSDPGLVAFVCCRLI